MPGTPTATSRLTIDYIPPAQQADAEYVVQALEDIGINTELNVSPDFPTWAARVAAGEHQMTINNVWNWGDPVIGVHRTYLSTQPGRCHLDQQHRLREPRSRCAARQGRPDVRSRRAHRALWRVPGHRRRRGSDLLPDDPAVLAGNQPKVQNPSVGIWGLMSPMLDVWIAE